VTPGTTPPRFPRALLDQARAHAADLTLLGVALAHVTASLLLAPDGLFAKYPRLAEALASGRLTPAEASDASPGYLLLTLLTGPTALRWLQALAGGVAIVLVHRIGLRLGGRVAAWVAALCLAAAQPWLVHGAVLEPDLLIGVLATVAVAALLLGRPERLLGAMSAGGALGLAATLRPTALLFALLALAWLVQARWGAGGRKAGLRHGLAFTAALAAALLPVGLLHLRAGQPWAATMSAGQVLHQGHRPEGTGLGPTFPVLLKMVEVLDQEGPDRRPDRAHQLYRDLAEVAAGRPLPATGAERYWVDRTLAFARAEPVAFARQLGRKLIFLVAAPGSDTDVPDAAAPLAASQGLSLPLGWLTLAGAAGLLLGLRRPGPSRLVVAWVLSGAITGLLFYVQARYSLAILPAWCLLAGSGVAALVEARGAPRRWLPLAVVAALPFLLLTPGFVRDERRLEARQRAVPSRSSVDALRRAGRWDEARALYLEEQAAFPDQVLPFSRRGYGLDADEPALALRVAERARTAYGETGAVDAYLLAVLDAAAGRCDLAVPLAERAAEAGFRGAVADASLDPDLLIADCLLAGGQRGEALERVRRSLARWPGTLDGLARAVAAGTDRHAPELPRWEAALEALHDPASVRYALARQRRRWGDPAGALVDATWLVTRFPAAAPYGEFERAQALLDLGRTLEALQAYGRSLVVRVALPGARRFDQPFRALVAERPESLPVLQVALSHWSRRGVLGEVRALLARHPELAGRPQGGRPGPAGN
jgi:tetratricopeptide (TPR) repeat protein